MWLINTHTISMPVFAYEFLLKLEKYNLLVYLEMSKNKSNPYLAVKISNDLKNELFRPAKKEEITRFLDLINENNKYVSMEELVIKTIFSENFYLNT